MMYVRAVAPGSGGWTMLHYAACLFLGVCGSFLTQSAQYDCVDFYRVVHISARDRCWDYCAPEWIGNAVASVSCRAVPPPSLRGCRANTLCSASITHEDFIVESGEISSPRLMFKNPHYPSAAA